MMGNKRGFILPAAGLLLVLALLITPAVADTMIREENTDHDGNDYTSLFPGTAGYNGTAESCMENCLNQPACSAATFAARDQSCWLKEKVPVATQRSGMTSFVRQKEGAAGPVTASATQAGIAAPAGSPVPVATKKSPGFGWAAAAMGCLGVLAFLRKAA
jgi:PAN domain